MIQIINGLVEHWNTLESEDVEGISGINDIVLQEFSILEANGVPFTTVDGLPAKYFDIAVPTITSKSYVSLMPTNDGAGSVDFFAFAGTPADGTLRVAWHDELYVAAANATANDQALSLSPTPTQVPLDVLNYGLNISLAANTLVVDYGNAYGVGFNMYLSGVGTNGTMTLQARVNGAPVGAAITFPTTNQTDTLSFSTMVPVTMAATEALDFTLAWTATQAVNIDNLVVTMDSLISDGRPWTQADFRSLVVTPI
jgi:hypothetical protein